MPPSLTHPETLRRKFDSLREQSEALVRASSDDGQALHRALAATNSKSLMEVETLRRVIAAAAPSPTPTMLAQKRQ